VANQSDERFGRGAHVVQPGESIDSIAYRAGFFPETIWSHDDNTELREARVHRNVLLAGDRVAIPDKRPKDVTCQTNRTHTFVRRGVPAVFRVRLLHEGSPRASLAYRLEVGKYAYTGKTDAEGRIEHFVSPDAKRGRLVIGDEEEIYELRLGRLDPLSTLAGVSQRLANLGYDCSDTVDERTTRSIRAFQEDQELPVTGEVDDETREALARCHDEL
jgi:hypothetical protein